MSSQAPMPADEQPGRTVGLRRLGIIGVGGMAETLLAGLAQGLAAPLQNLSILVLPEMRSQAETLAAKYVPQVAIQSTIQTDLGAFIGDRPDLVAECAGHGAVRQYGAAILERGHDLMVISIGSLADEALRASLEGAAARGKAHLILPAGAVGGIDVLAAARLSGLEEVVYVGRKPPKAWAGTPAETLLDLGVLTEAATFYEGTAREAARDYPQNANVAATVALAGAGFDRTRVRLVADPSITRNVHEVQVRSGCADFTIRLEGRPSPVNPKTSLTAGYSMAREILNRANPVII